MIKRLLFIIKVALASTMLFGMQQSVFAHEGATGVVKERMDRFKASKESVKQIKRALKTEDWSVIQQEAKDLQRWASEMSDFFQREATENHLKPKPIFGAIGRDFSVQLTYIRRARRASSKLLVINLSKQQQLHLREC